MKLIRCGLAAAALCVASLARAVVSLPALNVDTANITVSGLSSGAVMAINMGYAYSATFRGVGIFAGTPYLCQYLYPYGNCQNNNTISAGMLSAMQSQINAWSGSQIDPVSNVATQKVYLFVGSKDSTVGPNPMKAVQTQYVNNGAAQVSFVQLSGAAHVYPTDFTIFGDNPCGTSITPYIANCKYDGAHAVLSQLYGALNPRNDAPALANYVEFNQREFTPNLGMGDTGWVYVPAACAAGNKCRLHVAFHGCTQAYTSIGDKFVKNTGYSRWADTNNIIVLFPQAHADSTSYTTVASGVQNNANGCWDTVGFYGADYAQKSGVQLAAIKAMVDRLASASH